MGRHAAAPPEVELCRGVIHAQDPREELREGAANNLEERPTMHRVKGVLHVDGGVDPVRMKLQMSVDRMHERVKARAASHAKLARERPCRGGSGGGSAGGREGVRREEVGGEATTEGEGGDHRDDTAEDTEPWRWAAAYAVRRQHRRCPPPSAAPQYHHNTATEEPGPHKLWQSATIEAVAEGIEGVSATARDEGGRVATGAVLSPRRAVPVYAQARYSYRQPAWSAADARGSRRWTMVWKASRER